uniref:Roadblock/LAMTOR2 domain-containing protein n=1 Tax=Amphora coffeiformis TaxID=265554 RepID=A0A7S3L790_9STRA|mmetsp:Transcript_10534/g.20247  ORF Transcript_10534/g.20247 Transcript_10534/m.20247 type:complete len:106 (+) Transcript_10534:115-432(+)|eukprot:scaffold11172_cov172-Amphora_coffeaeformis.AAC.1
MSTSEAPAAAHPNLQELQETVSRLSSHKGVEAVLILNRNGDIIAESSSSGKETAMQVGKLLQAARTFVQTTAPDDEVSFLQLRTQQRRELYVAPHEGYVLAVMKR